MQDEIIYRFIRKLYCCDKFYSVLRCRQPDRRLYCAVMAADQSAFIDWPVSLQAQKALADCRINGAQLFYRTRTSRAHSFPTLPCRNRRPACAFSCRYTRYTEATTMGKGLLLWLIGIPIPIIILVWLLGGLH